ncbi:hypothetical protein ACP4OV_009068 [Aristida adscensionis]
MARCTASAAAAAALAVAALIICGHAPTGDAQAWAAGCHLSDIHVSSVRTGRTVAGQPEYSVAVENRCACPQNGVRVRCAGGVRSAEAVDEGKIRAEGGGVCLVNDGMEIARGSPVVFTYVWRTPQEFAPAMAVSRCGYPPSRG